MLQYYFSNLKSLQEATVNRDDRRAVMIGCAMRSVFISLYHEYSNCWYVARLYHPWALIPARCHL